MAKSPRPQTAQELALMQGFPPPEDKLVTVANFQVGPYNRWGFQHISQILPTAPIGRGDGTAAALERRAQDLGALAFTGAGGRMTIAEMLETTYTDGFLVLKDGAIVAEQYFNGMGPHTRHLLMSVSKSLTGMLAGILGSGACWTRGPWCLATSRRCAAAPMKTPAYSRCWIWSPR